MNIYYFKQSNRQTGEVLGYFSMIGSPPENNHPTLFLEEVTREEFNAAINALIAEQNEANEESEEEDEGI